MELDFVFKLGSKVLDYQSDFTFGENLQVFNLKIWFWSTPLILLWKEMANIIWLQTKKQISNFNKRFQSVANNIKQWINDKT
jgi:hypothetical protein